MKIRLTLFVQSRMVKNKVYFLVLGRCIQDLQDYWNKPVCSICFPKLRHTGLSVHSIINTHQNYAFMFIKVCNFVKTELAFRVILLGRGVWSNTIFMISCDLTFNCWIYEICLLIFCLYLIIRLVFANM